MKSISEYMKVLENIEMSEPATGPFTVGSLIQALSKFDPDMTVQMTMNQEYQDKIGSVSQEDDYVLISD
jgi:hypothetical protein